ncbi:polyprenyl glycosylphosphotransferase [Pseudonocardia sp. EC080610-09]|nr:polyprenyl glycosylphosphotransferase [Pseudonocardia sp. EC080625-04]ALL78625.1 polyprenyl glycosylphosphotransferase [Pseudonocardia sp. EC080610-09]ALL84830.1 polyprenyl glycosylphosphotransferase [Pseudonocardia sp. EC080619-01]
MVVPSLDGLLLLTPVLWNPDQWKAVVVHAVLGVLLLTGARRYRARLQLGVLDELPSIVGRMLIATGIVAAVIAARHEQQSAVVFLTNAALVTALVVLGRALTTALIAWSRRNRISRHRGILIGGGPLAAGLADITRDDPGYALEVVGYVDDGPSQPDPPDVPCWGKVTDLDATVRRTGADVLIVADGAFSEREVLDAVRAPACAACDLLVVPRLHHFQTQGSSDRIGSIPVMRILTPSLRGPSRLVKRIFDLVLSGAALVVLSPVVALAALATRLEGGPGVIFHQERVGRDGRVFDCLKIRTLTPRDAQDSGQTWSVSHDDRVGPVGRFLRRTSIDELPQLWNILRGDMSLVGPRPERPFFVDRFTADFDRYGHRHRVQAGLTGLAQVNGLRGDTSIADRARYDNHYIENWTLWLDLKIVLRTFAQVLLARGR